MRPLLLDPDGTVDLSAGSSRAESDLVRDLRVDSVVGAMGGGDPHIEQVSLAAMLRGASGAAALAHRHAVLRDSLDHPTAIREMYDRATSSVADSKRVWRGNRPATLLVSSIDEMEELLSALRWFAELARRHATTFASDGLRDLLARLRGALDDEFFGTATELLQALRLPRGTMIGATLGRGAKGSSYSLLRDEAGRRSWTSRLLQKAYDPHGFEVDDDDAASSKALARLVARGLDDPAHHLTSAVEDVIDLLDELRSELAFYVGCTNLYDRLRAAGVPTCIPRVVGTPRTFKASDLHDVSLCLLQGGAVGNDVAIEEQGLVMITGANQGGKSTFLRSVGLSQLMMRAGMFVAARDLEASSPTRVLTHFTREEDATMTRGKLDEELARMSSLVDELGPGAALLLNESFAATNEAEGSEIARQVVRALVSSGVHVFYVTHLYDLASSLAGDGSLPSVFLRADRDRSFRVSPGPPAPTSHGRDIYEEVFRT